MLKVIGATLLSIVAGQETEIYSWNASAGKTTIAGVATETFIYDGEDKSVQFQFDWKVKSTKDKDFKARFWIQTYAQWEDLENPGKYAGVTCNVEYDNDDYSKEIVVDNFVNSDSLGIENEDIGKWSEVGTNKAPDEFQLFGIDEANKSSAYATNYQKNGKGEQSCRALATIYSEKSGEPVNEAINNFYWAIKEENGLDIETGYRVYKVKNIPFTVY